MLIGDTITLEITKLNSEGEGIGKVDNFVFFVKDTCPGDTVNCKITKLKKSFGYAELKEILTTSPERTQPRCKLHKVCGACNLQHIKYDAQLRFKKEILEDTLRFVLPKDVEIQNIIGSDDGYEYRAKIQYPVASPKNSNRILAGYYQKASHELINIKYCPIQPRRIDEIIEYIKEEAEKCQISAYNEKSHSGELRHIVIRYSQSNKKILVLLVTNTDLISESLKRLANNIYNEFEDVIGVSANFNTARNNVILGEKTICIIGQDYIEESLCDVNFKISGDTFFQVNPSCANKMFNYIKDFVKSNYTKPIIFDAYAGIAAFGICLNDIAKTVTSVELNAASIKKAEENIKEIGISNITPICADTLKYLKETKQTFDITITDPPRKGCDKEVLEQLLKVTKDTIVYVSCNPATLARDLEILLANGCKILKIQPFDMFPQTAHLETVVFIKTPQPSP